MKILVTGGAGFIGSHLVDAYIKAGHRVWVLDNDFKGKQSRFNKRAKYKKIDIRNKKKLNRLFKSVRFDVVNHHAAQMDVRFSVEDPHNDAHINIIGLLNILELCKQTKVKKIIFASSGGTIYGECTKPAKEGQLEIPLSPYGITKLAGEKYIQAYSDLFGLQYTILRYSNVYGPRQDPHGEAGVVAIFSGRMLRRKSVLVFGKGKQTRDFVYVKDVARANLLALKKGHNQILNIGICKEISVLQLIKIMSSLCSYKTSPVKKPARKGELNRSILNCNLAKKKLGWKPNRTVKQGLKETLAFFSQKENLDKI